VNGKKAGSSRPSRAAVVIVLLLCVTLAFGGTAAWALFREDPQVSDLQSRVATLSADLDEAKAALEQAGVDSEQLQARVESLKKRLGNSYSLGNLPVVTFRPEEHSRAAVALQRDLEKSLVQPMDRLLEEQGFPLLWVEIQIPPDDGEPFVYTVVYSLGHGAGVTYTGRYGVKGEPFPRWKVPCEDGVCLGFLH
jgi:hypothetical protein